MCHGYTKLIDGFTVFNGFLRDSVNRGLINPIYRHPYVTAAGKAGQKSFKPARKDTEALLEHGKLWAVDQETVSDCDIQMLSGAVLEFK